METEERPKKREEEGGRMEEKKKRRRSKKKKRKAKSNNGRLFGAKENADEGHPSRSRCVISWRLFLLLLLLHHLLFLLLFYHRLSVRVLEPFLLFERSIRWSPVPAAHRPVSFYRVFLFFFYRVSITAMTTTATRLHQAIASCHGLYWVKNCLPWDLLG